MTNLLIEPELNQIEEQVQRMGSEVEKAIELSIGALVTRNVPLAEQVIENDDRIDALELESDQNGIRVLALKSPEARDLRFVVAASKIVTILERIGDHASNIARAAIDLSGQPTFLFHSDIPQMAQIAREMLHDALEALRAPDAAAAARKIIERDDEIDLLYDRLFQELLDRVSHDPSNAIQATRLVLVGKNLERIGDCAKDICEEIVYMKEAQVIKHSRLAKE
ncbi:MAG: phosphate signaling complex protein PhoU [Blastocatellia bacterium]|nr:phosphate signaling complex protein PhoU [Blastocatellia bacterium]